MKRVDYATIIHYGHFCAGAYDTYSARTSPRHQKPIVDDWAYTNQTGRPKAPRFGDIACALTQYRGLTVHREARAYLGCLVFHLGFYGAGIVAFCEHIENIADPAGELGALLFAEAARRHSGGTDT